MSTELKDKLEQVKASKSDVTIKMEAMGPSLKALVELQENRRDEIALLDTEIAALEKQIAAEAKPKPRHGDYGFDEGGGRAMSLKHTGSNGLRRVSKTCVHSQNCNDTHYEAMPSVILGNIFDDLKALQEDVTEFEVKATGAYPTRNTVSVGVGNSQVPNNLIYIHLKRNFDNVTHFTLSEFEEFTMNCRKKLATLKRNK